MKIKTGYHDFTSWLFVLNSNLTPIFPPKNNGEYNHGGIAIANNFPLIKKNILAANLYQQFDSTSIEFMLINESGAIIKNRKFNNYKLNGLLTVVNDNRSNLIWLSNNGRINLLDENFQLIHSKKITNINASFSAIKLIKYNFNNNLGILLKINNKIILLDLEFNVLATTQFDDFIPWQDNTITLRQNGIDKNPQLGISASKAGYLYSLEENKIYTFMPKIILVSWFACFLLLNILHYSIKYFLTYFNYFNHTIYKSTDGKILLNNKGEVSFNNKRSPIIFGGNKIKGISYKNFFENFPQISRTIFATLENKEKIIINKSDFNFKGEIRITPFKFFNYPFAYLVEIIDYTKQISADRMKTWSSTIQRIAHDIKTPLSGINLGLDTLQSKLAIESDEYSTDISLIQNEVDKIKNLTKNFLLFSNLEKPNSIRINVKNLLHDSLSIFRSYFDSGIDLTITSSDYTIIGDYGQLKQLFNLIIENAIDACYGTGKINILVTKNETHSDTDQKNKKRNIKIIVSDNGIGISQAELIKIFEPYYSTKKDGTGIGLAITKNLLKIIKEKLKLNLN